MMQVFRFACSRVEAPVTEKNRETEEEDYSEREGPQEERGLPVFGKIQEE